MQKAKKHISLLIAIVITIVSAAGGLTLSVSAAEVTATAQAGYTSLNINGYLQAPVKNFQDGDSLDSGIYTGDTIYLGAQNRGDVGATINSLQFNGRTDGGNDTLNFRGNGSGNSLKTYYANKQIPFTLSVTLTDQGTPQQLGLNLRNLYIDDNNGGDIQANFSYAAISPYAYHGGVSYQTYSAPYNVTDSHVDYSHSQSGSSLYNDGQGQRIYSELTDDNGDYDVAFGSADYGLSDAQESAIASAGSFNLTIYLSGNLREPENYTLSSDLVNARLYAGGYRGQDSITFQNIDPKYIFDADDYARNGGRSDLSDFLFTYLTVKAGSDDSPNFISMTLDYSGYANYNTAPARNIAPAYNNNTISASVESNPIVAFDFAVEKGTVYKGKTYSTLTPEKSEIFPEDYDSTIAYTSSNNAIVAVDDTGEIMAMKAGTATITATTSSGVSDFCVITVKNPSVGLSAASAKIAVGKANTITVTTRPAAASFSVSSYPSGIVSASKTQGSVTLKGKKKGSTVVTITANGVSKKIAVTVY